MIRLCAPEFDSADVERIRSVLESGWLVQGQHVAALEEAISSYIDAPAIACASGTAALHLAALAIGLGPDDEVIVPAFTWPSTVSSMIQNGARPVFLDIDPDTLSLRPQDVEAAITERTRAIVLVHLFGVPAPVREVSSIAANAGAVLIEDAACALGTTIGEHDQMAGTFGDIGCYSLHPRKSITTGEGGLLTAKSSQLVDSLKSWLNHGQDRSTGHNQFIHPGLNYRMSDVAGALGVGQAAKMRRIFARRREIGRYLFSELSALGVRCPQAYGQDGNSFQAFTFYADSAEQRSALIAGMRERGVETTVGTYSVVEQPYYRETYGVNPDAFPAASAAADCLTALPVHHQMSDDDVVAVVSALQETLRSTKR